MLSIHERMKKLRETYPETHKKICIESFCAKAIIKMKKDATVNKIFAQRKNQVPAIQSFAKCLIIQIFGPNIRMKKGRTIFSCFYIVKKIRIEKVFISSFLPYQKDNKRQRKDNWQTRKQ